MSGADIAAKVSAAIAKAGAATGDGTKLQGTILRQTYVEQPQGPPVLGAPQEFACTVLLTSYSARDREAMNLTTRDLKAMIAADAETDPRNDDRLRVAGREYSLTDVRSVMPGGTVLYWNATAKAGE